MQESDCTIFGAPNFREAALNIYGVAQPTFIGLLTIIKHLFGQEYAGITWISTREEPIIYINDVPFVLREQDSPFSNIAAYAGINSFNLEQMEERLADDVLKEAKANGGNIVVHDEKGWSILLLSPNVPNLY